MKIKTNQEFLHGTKRYRPNKTYEVPEGLGTYFVMSGWASSSEVTADGEPVSEVDLEVDDVAQGQGSEVN